MTAHIKVMKEPNSALQSFDAVGGVINIVADDPVHNFVSRAAALAGIKNFRELLGVPSASPSWKSGIRLSASVCEEAS